MCVVSGFVILRLNRVGLSPGDQVLGTGRNGAVRHSSIQSEALHGHGIREVSSSMTTIYGEMALTTHPAPKSACPSLL